MFLLGAWRGRALRRIVGRFDGRRRSRRCVGRPQGRALSRRAFLLIDRRRRAQWRCAPDSLGGPDGAPERRCEADNGKQTANDRQTSDDDNSGGALRRLVGGDCAVEDRQGAAALSRNAIVSVRRFRLARIFGVLGKTEALFGEVPGRRRHVPIGRRMVFRDRRYSLSRSEAFPTALFVLVTLEALDEPIVDWNFLVRRRRAFAATRLMARRLGALFLLSAPERFSDPIITRYVAPERRSDSCLVAGRSGAQPLKPLILPTPNGAERPIAFENLSQNSSPLTGFSLGAHD